MNCEYESGKNIDFTDLIPETADYSSRSVINNMIAENRDVRIRTVMTRVYRIEVEGDAVLYTRVFSPDFEKDYPVILIRTPYSALSAGIQMYCAAAIMAMSEYAVVLQDCRGTGLSGGEWSPFANERADGLFTIEWVKAQSWSLNRIAMYGPSYLTLNQWLVADVVPVEVKTLFLAVAGTERYRQMYMGGMFRHEIYTMWAVENSGIETDRNPGELYRDALKIKPHIDMDRRLFGAELPWYRDWITNPSSNSELWNSGLWKDLKEIPSKVSIPVHMIAGWFDHHLDGMCEAYRNLPRSIRKKSRFLIGPWDHSFKTPGDIECRGDINLSTFCLKEAVEWFDFQLKGKVYPHEIGGAETYIINDHSWMRHDDWPVESEGKFFFLNSGKEENKGLCRLSEKAPEKTFSRQFVYDSADPVETLGGSALLAWIDPEFHGAKHGCVLQPAPGYRDDVISFVSEPVSEDLIIVGNIQVSLNVSSSAFDSCFSVKVIEENRGRYFNICDGISTLEFRAGNGMKREYSPQDITQVKIEMWPVAWKLAAGSSIRIDISSSNFPMYNVHRNQSEIWSKQKEDSKALNTIVYGGDYSSHVLFPALS